MEPVCSFYCYMMTNQTRNDTRLGPDTDEYERGWQWLRKHNNPRRAEIGDQLRMSGKRRKRLYVRSLPNSDTFILGLRLQIQALEHDPSLCFST